jgi:AraC-like DNA-binding protein
MTTPGSAPDDAASLRHGRPSAPVVARQSEDGIVVATVGFDGLSAEERAHRYALAINGLFDTRTLTADPQATLQGFFLDALHVTFGTISARVSRRTAALCARDRADGILLHLTRAGRWQARIADRAVDGEAGSMVLLDLAQPFTVSTDADQGFVIVTIPRVVAERLAPDPRTLHGRTIDPTAGGVLAGFLGSVVTHAAAIKAEQAPALAEMLIELIGLGFRADAAPSTGERRGPRRRLRDRVERLIAMRLNAEDLTPDWVARKLGLSRSELYAAFPTGGGVARLIWEKRLAAARLALTDPLDDRTIGAIARSFGFASDAHFSRAFKQRFDCTPTAARKAARG